MTNMDIKNEKALNKVLSIFSSDELKKKHKNESIKKKTPPPSSPPPARLEKRQLAPTPLYVHLLGYFSHIFLVLVGYLREAYYGPGPIGGSKKHSHEMGRVGYAPLLPSFESFYTRCVFRRLKVKNLKMRIM